MAVPPDCSITLARDGHAILQHVADARAICPHCKIASVLTTRSHVFAPIAGTNAHRAYLVFECNVTGCRRMFFVQTVVRQGYLTLVRDDEFFMYPFSGVDMSHPSIPQSIAEDWQEAQKAIQASAPKAAAVMCRRVLYGVLMDKNYKLNPLHEGLKELISGQRLPAIFDEWLPAIKDDGHDGAHPDRALQVSTENITETIEYTSELLRFLYIEPYDFQQRKLRNAPAASPAAAAPSKP
jgi:Domain of unknown function (DUF4145)